MRGRFPARLALDQMLEGSGLALRAEGENRYLIYVDQPDPTHTSRLDPVRVYGEQLGERVYRRQEIATTPSSNRDLSTLVATHPAVPQPRRPRRAESRFARCRGHFLLRRQSLPEPVPDRWHRCHQPRRSGQ
ncbi:STN domain-containing protein [Achromobacter insuavis]